MEPYKKAERNREGRAESVVVAVTGGVAGFDGLDVGHLMQLSTSLGGNSGISGVDKCGGGVANNCTLHSRFSCRNGLGLLRPV